MLKRIFLIIVMLFPVAGCVPVILVAAGATTGAVMYTDNRPFKTIMQDRRASQTANNIMQEDQLLKDRAHISVAVYNHVALMVGQAQSDDLKKRAYNYVRGLPNINLVYDEVQISGTTSMIQRSNDSWLTTKVKTALAAEKGLRSNQIKVITENSIVYLMGILSPQQSQLATGVARRVDGVTKVVTVFQQAPQK